MTECLLTENALEWFLEKKLFSLELKFISLEILVKKGT